MTDNPQTRRREATRAMVRYFLLAFAVVLFMSGTAVYAVYQARAQHRDSRAIKIAYCSELEKLKTQNREEVAIEKKNYPRDLRLLHLKDSPELHKAAAERWARELRRNAPKSCPYTA